MDDDLGGRNAVHDDAMADEDELHVERAPTPTTPPHDYSDEDVGGGSQDDMNDGVVASSEHGEQGPPGGANTVLAEDENKEASGVCADKSAGGQFSDQGAGGDVGVFVVGQEKDGLPLSDQGITDAPPRADVHAVTGVGDSTLPIVGEAAAQEDVQADVDMVCSVTDPIIGSHTAAVHGVSDAPQPELPVVDELEQQAIPEAVAGNDPSGNSHNLTAMSNMLRRWRAEDPTETFGSTFEEASGSDLLADASTRTGHIGKDESS